MPDGARGHELSNPGETMMANDQGVPRKEERLSEADVSAVLARASDIEVTGQTAGLTVAELHEVAEQVGHDAAIPK